MDWIRKNAIRTLTEKNTSGVIYLSFDALEKTGIVNHGFSTRFGGVSKGKFSTMNFSYSRGDDPESVLENYKRMSKALGVDYRKMVVSYQTHTTNVKTVTQEDIGKGVVCDRDYRDIDGLICNIPGITLVTFYADCVPLYFLDPVKKAIGLSHSGWKGTVKRMGEMTVKRMSEEYGTKPEDLIACIGPSICKECYEVGAEVIEQFQNNFPENVWDTIYTKKTNGKYMLDLWEANRIVMLSAGIKDENIYTSDICTRCNPELLFSHRYAGENRGNLAAFLELV